MGTGETRAVWGHYFGVMENILKKMFESDRIDKELELSTLADCSFRQVVMWSARGLPARQGL